MVNLPKKRARRLATGHLTTKKVSMIVHETDVSAELVVPYVDTAHCPVGEQDELFLLLACLEIEWHSEDYISESAVL